MSIVKDEERGKKRREKKNVIKNKKKYAEYGDERLEIKIQMVKIHEVSRNKEKRTWPASSFGRSLWKPMEKAEEQLKEAEDEAGRI